jgi:hypothetical protein
MQVCTGQRIAVRYGKGVGMAPMEQAPHTTTCLVLYCAQQKLRSQYTHMCQSMLPGSQACHKQRLLLGTPANLLC